MADKALCSIPDCCKPTKAYGFCNPHYLRFRRHGNPLAGRINQGAAQEELQRALLSNNKEDCWIWPFATDEGRAIVGHDGRRQFAARVICQLTHGDPPTPTHEAAHSCGRGHLGCISKHHIRWLTHQENMAEAVEHGSLLGARKMLAAEDVLEIRRRHAEGASINKLSADFECRRPTISGIVARKSWAWVS